MPEAGVDQPGAHHYLLDQKENQFNLLLRQWDGYDHDPREIHIIPEVRRFYTAFHEAWPCWLYFCNLDMDNLRTMVIACLDNLAEIKVDGQPKLGVQCSPLELLYFIGRDFASMNLICERDVRGSDLPAHQGGV